MRDAVPRVRLLVPPVPQAARLHELAHRLLEISAAGLKRRAALDGGGMSEDGFLNPLRELVNRRGYTRVRKKCWKKLLRRLEPQEV